MADSFSKKEGSKKKAKKKQEKALRREDRKTNNNKGKSFEDMIVYVDVNGNFTSLPPHLQVVNEGSGKKGNSDSVDDGEIKSGIVTYLNEKGYGFITEDITKDNVFFNFDFSSSKFKKNDKVSFVKELSQKGFRASQIIINK